jgi:hypothetical protein
MTFLRKPAILVVGAMASLGVLTMVSGGGAFASPAGGQMPSTGVVAGGIPTCLTAQLAAGTAMSQGIASMSVPADTCPPDTFAYTVSVGLSEISVS